MRFIQLNFAEQIATGYVNFHRTYYLDPEQVESILSMSANPTDEPVTRIYLKTNSSVDVFGDIHEIREEIESGNTLSS